MIRLLAPGVAVLLAGCAAPMVVTRIDADAAMPLPVAASFALADVPADIAPLHQQATGLVAASLRQRGWREAAPGDYLLAVTLSDRPASARLQAGDDMGRPGAVIATAADRTTSRGCARRDHRLTIQLTERVSGALIYAGSGAEFHCKARLDDSLPHLVAAALDGLDGTTGPRNVERPGLR